MRKKPATRSVAAVPFRTALTVGRSVTLTVTPGSAAARARASFSSWSTGDCSIPS